MGFQRREISLPIVGKPIPLSVNWFPVRVCSHKCTSCHQASTGDPILPLDEAKRALGLLADAGMKHLHVSGGDPFLQPHYIGEVFKFCKEELHIASCSVVNSGPNVTERWLDTYGTYLDVMAIACNSLDTNLDRENATRKDAIVKVAQWAKERGVKVQVNTVVSINNWEEDMNDHIREIDPCQWKVSQVSIVDLENAGRKSNALRNKHRLKITKEQYQAFLDRHKEQTSLILDEIEDSFLSVDERMCFINRRVGDKKPSRSILEVGVETALLDSGRDEKKFLDRDRLSERTKAPGPQSLDW